MMRKVVGDDAYFPLWKSHSIPAMIAIAESKTFILAFHPRARVLHEY